MSLAASFEAIAANVTAAFGAPYFAANRITETAPVIDDGGSIVTPGETVVTPCKVQVDDATEAMRRAEGFAERDMRMLILALDALDTDARISISEGPWAGTWSIQSVSRDPAGIGFVCRGRRA